VADILAGTPPPEFARAALAYKTGTSYGYRDAWAVGFDGRYVLGVWVGRPDNAAVPGLTGYATAAPLLFEAFERLPGPHAPLPKAPPDDIAARHRRPAGRPAALQPARPARSRRAAHGAAAVIVHPPDGASVDLDGPSLLALKLEGGAAPFRWLANGRPLDGLERRRSLFGSPTAPAPRN
jgi:penicillin-binding protein 1C